MLTTLKIIHALGDTDGFACDYTSGALCEEFGVSLATLKRHIAEARHLGAAIESYREGGASYYRLKNWTACKERVNTWINLMEKDNVLSGYL